MTNMGKVVNTNNRNVVLARALNQWMMILAKLPKLAMLLKVAKAGKLLTLAGSMAISIVAYAYASGSWLLGVGLVGLLLVHELGHVWVAYRNGVRASWPIFIPFIGAAIFIKKFNSIRTEAWVAVAGPVVGSTGALILVIPYLITGDPAWRGLIYLGILLNAFNLIPIKPLDGGRMTAICGRWFKLLGLGMLAALSLAVREPAMLYIWVLVLIDIPFPLWWRTVTGVVLSGLMMGLMVLGYSHQPWYIDYIDSSVVALLCLTYYAGEWRVSNGGDDPFKEVFEDEALVTSRERWCWALAWMVMCVVLGLLLWAAVPRRM